MHRRVLRAEHLLLAIDLMGTALFAAEGTSTGMAAGLDLLGVLVLAFTTALGGGIVRDVLIGATPPGAIRDWRYATTALGTSALIFALGLTTIGMHPLALNVLDAAGLSFFAIAGAVKASEYGLHPLLATMMGGITGVGGGTIRDVLIMRVPVVLHADFYAAAALTGSAVTLLCLKLRVPAPAASATGIACCFILRVFAIHYGWQLPHASLASFHGH